MSIATPQADALAQQLQVCCDCQAQAHQMSAKPQAEQQDNDDATAATQRWRQITGKYASESGAMLHFAELRAAS